LNKCDNNIIIKFGIIFVDYELFVGKLAEFFDCIDCVGCVGRPVQFVVFEENAGTNEWFY
jgi:hypothetical protein